MGSFVPTADIPDYVFCYCVVCRRQEVRLLYSCMNNTKWTEIWLAIIAMESLPIWRITYLNGYQSLVDDERFYHFKKGAYLNIHYLDVVTNSVEQHSKVGTIFRLTHLFFSRAVIVHYRHRTA